MEFFWLLLLSVPFFYILGVIQLVSWFSQKSKKELPVSRDAVLTLLIQELSSVPPHRTVADQLDHYKKQLSTENNPSSAGDEIASSKQTVPVSPLNEDVSTVWSRWYATNSINLLLYVGAFFIVASASIFVSFQWESISGVTKAMMLTLCSLLFFGCGAWFYRLPKIQNAGATFLAIGSLLIPIVGTGWYTFVLADIGNTLGTTWLITSLVAILSYAALALSLKNRFYSYLMTLSSISIVLSFINIASLHHTFYILGGIISSYLLLIASLLAKKLSNLPKDLFAEPTGTASQLLLPASLLFGLVLGLQNESLFNAEGTVSILLASGYYLLLYLQKPYVWNLVAAQVLLLLTPIIYGVWMDVSDISLCYSLAILSFAYLLSTLFYRERRQEVQASFLIATGQLLLIFLYGLSVSMPAAHLVIFTSFPALAGLFMAFMKRDYRHLHLTSVFTALTLFILHTETLFPWLQEETAISLIYTVIALILYGVQYVFKEKSEFVKIITPAIFIYSSLGIFFSFSETAYLAGSLFLFSLLSFHSAFFYRKKDLIYLAAALLTFGVAAGMQSTDLEYTWYPIVFSALSYGIYTGSLVMRTDLKHAMSGSAFVIATITPIMFGITGYNSDEYESTFIERSALITAYSGMVLISLHMVLQKTYRLGYFLSGMGLLTYLWQINYLDVTEGLAYTLPVGAYLIGLAFVRKLKHKTEDTSLLDGLGLLFLLGPSIASVYGDDSLKHIVVLLLLGVGLLLYGISSARTLYKRAGIGALIYAVFSQTYDYIYQLPRWILVGLLGFGLIGIAIFLLLRRHDEQKK